MSKIKILAFGAAFLLTLALVLTVVWGAYYCNKSIDQIFMPKVAQIHKGHEPFFGAILADLKTLEAAPLFAPTTYNNDAEKVLSTYASWSNAETESLNTPPHALIRSIAKDYAGWRSKSEILLKLSQDPRLDNINTDWMNSLAEFDHWDVFKPSMEKAGLKDVNNSGLTKTRLMANGPLPNYAELSVWAVVHFIKLYKSGKTLEAYKSFHKTAELIHSSATLIGNMVVATMLKGENTLLATFPLPERKANPVESIDAYRRLSWAWTPLITRTHFYEFPEQFKPYLKSQNGLCGGANEAMRIFPALQEYLLPHISFEKYFSKNMKYSQDFQKQVFGICGLQKHENFLNNVEAGFIIPAVDSMDPRTLVLNSDYKPAPDAKTINASKIPFARQALALLFYTVGVPDYLKYYREMKK